MIALTLLALLFAEPQWLDGEPALSTRYVSHVGVYSGDTWFRWCFSGDGCESDYDVMWVGQDDMLRYYQTVTPTRTVTFASNIVFGPVDPEGFETGTGTTAVSIAGDVSCTGEVAYRWTAQRSANEIILTQHQELTFSEGPCDDGDHYEYHVIDADGVRQTSGPGWTLRREP